MLSSIVMYHHRDNDVAIFGNNRKVVGIMFLRSVVGLSIHYLLQIYKYNYIYHNPFVVYKGYGGIAFAFLAVERLPIGDATVLTMLAPFVSMICPLFLHSTHVFHK